MSNNLVLGRGEVYFDRFLAGTQTKIGERYLGATPSFSVSAETQELEHFSSERGLRVKDESVTLQIDVTGQLTVENMSDENVALFFFGDAETATISAATGTVNDFTVQPGLFYQLGATALKPEGVENVTTVTVLRNPATDNVAAVLNTDYRLDAELGRIEIIPGGAFQPGDIARVTFNTAAQTQGRVLSGSTLIQGAMRFISYNGVGGQRNFYMPKVTLRPNGEFALKGEEWQNISFNLEILAPGPALSALIAASRGVTS